MGFLAGPTSADRWDFEGRSGAVIVTLKFVNRTAASEGDDAAIVVLLNGRTQRLGINGELLARKALR